jgi:hypothetical protein
MKNFIKQETIRRYRTLLERTSDPAERRRIGQLLAEEERGEGPADSGPPGKYLVLIIGKRSHDVPAQGAGHDIVHLSVPHNRAPGARLGCRSHDLR